MTRGERLNNPCCIEREPGVLWRGMADDQSADPTLISFVDPIYSFRAATRLLRTYHVRGYTTLATIFPVYSPRSENDTDAYIAAVEKSTGIPRTQPLTLDNGQVLSILKAIAQHENGECIYTDQQIQNGIDLEAE